jgi:hypothetical protein
MSVAKTPPTKPVGTGGSGDGEDSNVTPVQAQTEAEQPIIKRRKDLVTAGTSTESRLPDHFEWSFNSSSMVGSWFHRLENDRMIWQGVIVGEPQPGTYLIQIDRLDLGAENVQRLVSIKTMLNDEDGYDWRFYDSETDAKSAYAAWIATERERAAA